jgi:hypothetical protein
MDLSGLGQRPVASCFGRGNEPSCFVVCWQFLDYLTDY